MGPFHLISNQPTRTPPPTHTQHQTGLIYPPEEGASLNFVSAQALRKAPLHGPIKALVVLVEFPNTRFQAGFTKEHFEV